MGKYPPVIEKHLPDGIGGLWDPHQKVIYIDPRLDARTYRATLEHELVHAERGDNMLGLTKRERKRIEAEVERIAARRLVTTGKVIDGLTTTIPTLCEVWDVDARMAVARLNGLSRAETIALRTLLAAGFN